MKKITKLFKQNKGEWGKNLCFHEATFQAQNMSFLTIKITYKAYFFTRFIFDTIHFLKLIQFLDIYCGDLLKCS